MAKKKSGKSNAQLIVNTLLTGDSLRSREISRRISEAAGRHIKIQDVASMLSKLSDSRRCNIGFFIRRTKEGTGFVYSMVEEALELSEEQAYGLTLKTGQDRYPLEDAIQDFPGLRKYVESEKGRPGRKVARKPAKSRKPAKKIRPAAAYREAGNPSVTISGDNAIDILIGKIIQRAVGSGDLNINLKVSVRLEDD